MTPEECAKQLVHKYRLLLMESDSDLSHEISITIYSIKFALIAVDEMVELCPVIPYGIYYLQIRDYLLEAKQEIEKLQ